jgi:type IV pilus assembly protein PilY1
VDICQPGQQVRTVTQTSGAAGDSLKTKNGWYVDFPAGAGEQEFTDPKLVLGTLVFTTSVPKLGTGDVCKAKTSGSEGTSFVYNLDYKDGSAVNGSVAGVSLGTGVATTPQIAQLPDGSVISIVRLSSGQEKKTGVQITPPQVPAGRISWRELISP